MTGPQPAGRPWTQAEEAQLRELIGSKVNVGYRRGRIHLGPMQGKRATTANASALGVIADQLTVTDCAFSAVVRRDCTAYR